MLICKEKILLNKADNSYYFARASKTIRNILLFKALFVANGLTLSTVNLNSGQDKYFFPLTII